MTEHETPEQRADTEEAAGAFVKDETEATPTDEAGVREAITRGDRREYEAADRLRRRSRRTSSTNIPGVTIDDRGRARTHHPPKGTAGWRKKGEIHPRKKGTVRPAKYGVLTDDYEMILDLVYDLLGSRRVRILRKTLASRGKPNAEQQLARTYLSCLLKALDSTLVQKAAAELLLLAPPGDEVKRLSSEPGLPFDRKRHTKALRTMADLRRRPVTTKELGRFEYEFIWDLGRVADLRRKQGWSPGTHA